MTDLTGLFFVQSQRSIETTDRAPEYNVTNLPNGFTVLTESQTFPSAVQMGKQHFLLSF